LLKAVFIGSAHIPICLPVDTAGYVAMSRQTSAS
jgi:hypothetical protein